MKEYKQKWLTNFRKKSGGKFGGNICGKCCENFVGKWVKKNFRGDFRGGGCVWGGADFFGETKGLFGRGQKVWLI